MDKLGESESLDSFSSNSRVEPVAGPMGRNQSRSSINRFNPMRSNRVVHVSNRVVHVSNSQDFHVYNGYVVREREVQLEQESSSSPIHIAMETPRTESDDRSNQSMERRAWKINKLNLTKRRLNFEKEDSF